MKFIIIAIAGVSILLGIFFILGRSRPEIVAGGLYSARAGQDKWGIIKVIGHDGNGISVRIYSNKFKSRPADINPSELFIAGIKDPSGHEPGIGHLPVTNEVFYSWAPQLIRTSEITEDELSSYNEFKNAGGMPFDSKLLKK